MDTVTTSLQPEYTRYFRIGIVTILAVSFLLLLGVIFLNSGSMVAVKKESSLAKENTALVSHANGIFQAMTDKQEVKVGETFTVTVVADSDNKSVMGYDVVMRFPSTMSYIGSRSLMPNFDIFDTRDTGSIIVTGAKKLDVVSDIYMQNTPIVELQFKAQAPGKASFDFDMRPDDRTDSNMFSVQNVDLLGSVKNTTIEVR